jgi:hypothetical protein
MLAVLGYVVPEVFRFPAAINVEGTTFAEIPNGKLLGHAYGPVLSLL